MSFPVAVPLLLLWGATAPAAQAGGPAALQPASVPAHGEQEATLTLGRAGMVRLTAKGSAGTACTVVDHLRGPFVSDGQVGVKDCAADLLLDAGVYRVRLASPPKGKGNVALTATPFAEQNPTPVRLEPGRAVEQPLAAGQQASFWLHLDARQLVVLRAAGRTAGVVQLWRAGTWREGVPTRDAAPTPSPGQPIHEWWLEANLEPGDYLFTAYGTAPTEWAQSQPGPGGPGGGKPSDLLTVQYGFTPIDARAVAFTLPASGLLTLAPPPPAKDAPSTLTAVLALDAAPPAPTTLHVARGTLLGNQGNCGIAPRTLTPECVVQAGGDDGRGHVFAIRGAPGTRGTLLWAPRSTHGRLVDGEYGGSATLPIEPLPAGEYLVGLHDVPPDPDSLPIGCALFREPTLPDQPRALLGVDLPHVGPGRPLDRAFNTTGEQTVWFEITGATRYRIATDPARKQRCELYRVEARDTVRVSRTSDEARCLLTPQLEAGRYELRLSGGGRGIDRLRIAAELDGTAKKDTPPRTACLVRARLPGGDAPLALSVSRGGTVATRGLVARPLPLTLAEPLPLEVPAGETLRLPVNLSGTLRVRAAADRKAPACALAKAGAGAVKDGACVVEAKGQDELALTAPPDAPVQVWLERVPAPRPPPPPLAAHSPALAPIPALSPAQPTFVDLAPDEPHAFTFRVDEPGLYHVRTEGLLATACTLRTPTVPELSRAAGGGRGRNCLLAAYLDAGTYLVAVQSTGRSRGRAAVVLEHRPVRDLAPVAADGEAFFRVPAGDLVRERLTIAQAGDHALSTAAPGAALQCRLEDAQGWPLVAVPTACGATYALPRGDVLWTQLPLTVESMRHTRLARERPAEVLRGEAPHPVALWTRYAVELAKGGRDTFTFALDADLDLYVLLTGGMQGRLYREGDDRPVELIPALDDGPDDPGPTRAADGEEGGEAEAAPPPEYQEGDGESEPSEGEEAATPEVDAPTPPAPRARPTPVPAIISTPPGRRLALSAGRYRLVTEHSRGDVGITYALQLSTEVLTPGVERDLPVPSTVTVRVPRAGTLRLRTRGDADVRCRLFDAAGRLVAESSEVGADWNCGLAQPLAPGDYRLALESETQVAGATRVVLSAPETVDAGALEVEGFARRRGEGAARAIETGRKLALADKVLTAALPAPADAVVQLELAANEPFSCALVDGAGAVASAQLETKGCSALLLPRGKAYRLRLWTLDPGARPLEVTARVAVRPIAPLAGGKVAAAAAGRAEVARAGRYRTAEGVLCAPADAAGLLRPCGPEVSLEPGAVVFASPAGDARVPLEELTQPVDERRTERRALTHLPLIETLTSKPAAVHLLSARAAPGERAAPFCALEGGVHAPGAPGDAACFAASSPGARSTARVFAPSDAPVEIELTREAVPLPSVTGKLEPGRQVLTLPAATARYTLPAGPARLELLLPPATWAVLLTSGRTVDLCPPAPDLARCVLHAQGGELLLSTARERHVEATVLTLPAPPRTQVLADGPWEARLPPGTVLLRVPAATAERALQVEGATGCLVRRSDGARVATCAAPLPAGVTAEVLVDADGPVRALARPTAAAPASALFGAPLAAAAPPAVRLGEAVALDRPVERTFTLREPALVHLRADAGVCALVTGAEVVAADGLGRPCAIDRLLPAGAHRLAVRPFGGEPPAGTARVTAEPVETLGDGVGAERWVGPGETRLFRFHLATRGRVGLGLQQSGEVLGCTVLDAAQRPLAEGCQALLEVDAGDYLLAVHAREGLPPMRFRPVVLGLQGAQAAVPDDYLRDLFQRIGAQ